jgi:hypothetical protein
MNRARFNIVKPGTLFGQQAGQQARILVAFGWVVVSMNRGPNRLAFVPRGIAQMTTTTFLCSRQASANSSGRKAKVSTKFGWPKVKDELLEYILDTIAEAIGILAIDETRF